ncbi:TPA: colicin, partial [Escherichia coli]|nr:colicin [Escherichia coli]HDV2738077.1 colicin [Escherichia coli]
RNPVVTEDVEGDKKIYNAEVAEWDKLRQRLLDARNKITSAESAINSARNNVSARTNEQKHANDALNALLKEKENIRSQLADINQKIAEEKRKRDEINMVKDAIKLTSDFYRTIYDEFGKQASELAKELASVSQGKQIKSVDDALNAFDKFRNNLNKKYNIQDRMAISKALEAINQVHMAENFKLFSKAFGFTGKVIDRYDVAVELQKAVKTDNWRPFFVKLESLAAGRAASAVTAWAFSVMLGTPVGILGFAIIMAAVSALVNDKFIEQVNKLIGI